MGDAKKVIIIGAGIGGLATAALLAKAGYAVEIFERHQAPGGRAGVLHKDGFTFDTGPSWYLMPEVFAHYFSLLGEDVSQLLSLKRLGPAYKVFFEHAEALTISSDLAKDAATFEGIEPGAGAALTNYADQAARTYTLAMQHFLYTNFQNKGQLFHPDILKAAPHFARQLTTPLHNYVSRFVHDRRLQQILEYPMVFLGTSPFEAPAMYSLMSHLDFKQGVWYPKGGMYTIIEALVSILAKLGVRIHYGAEVTSICIKKGRATGIILQDDTTHHGDIIISNADLHFTETMLLPTQLQTYPEKYWHKRTPGPSALLLYLGVQGKLPQLTHHNLFFVDAWCENFTATQTTQMWSHPASMYVCKPSQTDASVAPPGHENVFMLVPGPARTGVADTAGLAERYIAQFAKMAGIADLPQRIVSKTLYGPDDFAAELYAWRGTALGMAHTLPQSAFFRPANKSRKVKGLYYVGGNTVPGIGLPMCLIGAEVLFKRLLGDRSSGPLREA